MNTKKSKLTPLKIVILVSGVLLAGIVGYFLYSAVQKEKVQDEMTCEKLAKLSTQAIMQYPYSMLVLDSQTTIKGETTTCEYVFTTSLNDSVRTYLMRDAESVGYQCWKQNDKGTYDVYLYDDVYEVWVKTEEEYEPVASNTWMVTADLSNYTLLPERDNWGDDECYVCQITGSSDVFETIYEEVYIRCSDFMPLGIMSYGVSSADGDRLHELDPATFGEGVEEAEMITEDFVETISVYSVQFSNEDMALYELPETYMTDVEYMEAITQIESESESDAETNN